MFLPRAVRARVSIAESFLLTVCAELILFIHIPHRFVSEKYDHVCLYHNVAITRAFREI
jgi:hypothetical protein